MTESKSRKRITKLFTLITALSVSLVSSQWVNAQQHQGHNHEQHAAKSTSAQNTEKQIGLMGDPYPFSSCIISGQELGAMGKPVLYNHEGREIKFCCSDCTGKFKADPVGYIQKLDDAIVKQQMPYYPLATCVVSGEKLGGSMGDPINYVHKNRLIRFCCASCKDEFNKDPDGFLSKLNQAVIAKQKPGYPLKNCVVTGEVLGSMGDPVELVIGNRLVRLCCNACVAQVKAEPQKFLSKIETPTKAKSVGQSEGQKPDDHSGHKH